MRNEQREMKNERMREGGRGRGGCFQEAKNEKIFFFFWI